MLQRFLFNCLKNQSHSTLESQIDQILKSCYFGRYKYLNFLYQLTKNMVYFQFIQWYWFLSVLALEGMTQISIDNQPPGILPAARNMRTNIMPNSSVVQRSRTISPAAANPSTSTSSVVVENTNPGLVSNSPNYQEALVIPVSQGNENICITQDPKTNDCLRCSYGWDRLNGTCLSPLRNCATYNNRTGDCIICNRGFYLALGNCRAADLQCMIGNCTKCQNPNTRILINRTCLPFERECVTADRFNTSNCIDCRKGYVAYQNVCVKVSNTDLLNCLVENQNRLCVACKNKNNVFNLQGLCVPNQTSYNCLISNLDKTINCNRCSCQTRTDECWQPQEKGKANDPYCQAVETFTCPTVNNSRCIECQKGYAFDSQGRCTKRDPNCQQFGCSGNLCTRCSENYTLDNGVCLENSTVGCIYYNTTGGCINCSRGRVLTPSGLCALVSSNCRLYDSRGLCIDCYIGKTPNTLHRCPPVATNSNSAFPNLCRRLDCSRCNTFYSASYNSICFLIDYNCIQYNNRGLCAKCKPGFVLGSGQCVQTRPNLFEYYEPKCLAWRSGVCVLCSLGYGLNYNHKCIYNGETVFPSTRAEELLISGCMPVRNQGKQCNICRQQITEVALLQQCRQ